MPLFEHTGLEQDTGLLSERWGQEGSEVINTSTSTSSDVTLRTVTAGKVFYVTTVFVSVIGGGSGNFDLRDGGLGGSVRFGMVAGATDDNETVFFTTPLKFETDVFYNETGASGSRYITLSGWEEDA